MAQRYVPVWNKNVLRAVRYAFDLEILEVNLWDFDCDVEDQSIHVHDVVDAHHMGMSRPFMDWIFDKTWVFDK